MSAPDPDRRDFDAVMRDLRYRLANLISAGNVYADRVSVQNSVADVIQEEFDRAATEAVRRRFAEGQS